MSDFPRLLASETGVTRRTVTRWCAAGKVPGAYRTRGGHWRLRKPRRETCWGRYEDKIVEFVVRYTSVPGDPLSVRQAEQLNKIIRWLDEKKLVPAAASILGGLVLRRADNTPLTIDWEFAEEMEKLIDSGDFNDALESSLVLKGISEDDKLPVGWEKVPIQERGRVMRQHFEDLKDRDSEKYDLLTKRDMRQIIHPRAYEAARTPRVMLKVHATRLKLNLHNVTPTALARELKIAVGTLYRQYGREAVKDACRPAPVRDDELQESHRYQNRLRSIRRR